MNILGRGGERYSVYYSYICIYNNFFKKNYYMTCTLSGTGTIPKNKNGMFSTILEFLRGGDMTLISLSQIQVLNCLNKERVIL